jgi:hypothetical protein
MPEPAPKKPRFVFLTDTVRLPLSEGDWIEVRRSLSYGQTLDLLADTYRSADGGAPTFDAVRFPLAEMEAWLCGWSFTEPSGDPVPVNAQTIRALDPATAQEIITAIRGHDSARRGGVDDAGAEDDGAVMDPKAAGGADSTS